MSQLTSYILYGKKQKCKHKRGINPDSKVVSLSKLYYKQPNDRTIFPNRYYNLIHRK